MNIKILGPGCAKCHSLEKTVKEVVSDLKLDVKVEAVQDIRKILEYKILMTPGLVINENLVSSGKIPNKAEVERLITSALAREEKG